MLMTSCATNTQLQCSSKQLENKKVLKAACGPETRVTCWDREKKNGFTQWCEVGYLKTLTKKLHGNNVTVLSCEQKIPKWTYTIPWDYVCEVTEETVCKVK